MTRKAPQLWAHSTAYSGKGSFSPGTCGRVPKLSPFCPQCLLHVLPPIPIPRMFHLGQSGNKWEHAAAAGRKGASSWQSLHPTEGWSFTLKNNCLLLCHAACRLSPPRDVLPTLWGLFTSWLFHRLLSAYAHTHTKYTMLPANILITTLNKRLIRSLKGIFLSVALCCCGNRIPRAYPEIRLFLRYWIILLTFRIGKAKIIPSKQADLWRSLIFSFSLHLA